MKRKGAMAAGVAGLVMLGLVMLAGVAATPIGRQVVSRDAFPVFDDPEMVSALDAERRGLVRDRDAVIGGCARRRG